MTNNEPRKGLWALMGQKLAAESQDAPDTTSPTPDGSPSAPLAPPPSDNLPSSTDTRIANSTSADLREFRDGDDQAAIDTVSSDVQDNASTTNPVQDVSSRDVVAQGKDLTSIPVPPSPLVKGSGDESESGSALGQRPSGRGLWSLMQHSSTAPASPNVLEEQTASDASNSVAADANTAANSGSPQVKRDKRLNQIESLRSDQPPADIPVPMVASQWESQPQPASRHGNRDSQDPTPQKNVPVPASGDLGTDAKSLSSTRTAPAIVESPPRDLSNRRMASPVDLPAPPTSNRKGTRGDDERSSIESDQDEESVELVASPSSNEVDSPSKTRTGIARSSSIKPIPSPTSSSSEVVLDLPLKPAGDIPSSGLSVPKTGKSQPGVWCLLLGILSVPLSLISILPGFLMRLPSSVIGFAALILGFVALGEIQRSRGRLQGRTASVAGMILGLYGMFSGPWIYAPLDVYGQISDQYTRSHLAQISAAVEVYHQQKHAYPPGNLLRTDKETGRMLLHGWMAQILPYMTDHAALASRIDWSKPYDDIANERVFHEIIPEFLATGGSQSLILKRFGPAHFAGLGGLTTLADGSTAHVGVFDYGSRVDREDIPDGLSNTFLAGEIADEFPAWGDTSNWRQIGKGINRSSKGFGNSRNTGALFLMLDGSVRFYANQTDLKVLQSLSTRDGGEAF